LSCQISRKRLTELANLGRYRGRCHVNRPKRTILGDKGMSGDHFGAILVEIWGIKCTLKVAYRAVIFGQNRGRQWIVTRRRVVWSSLCFFLKLKTVTFWAELGIFCRSSI
jgi:hypothetical protein